jgi:hypothetical protein
MSHRLLRIVAICLATFVAVLGVATAWPRAGSAAPDTLPAADDRELSAQAGWQWYYNQTAAEITFVITSSNSRLVDIDVASTGSPRRFNAAYVTNSGVYQKNWVWNFDMTTAQVDTFLTINNARVISIKGYLLTAGNVRFVVVAVDNTGANQKNSGWWWGDQAFVNSKISSGDRLVQLSSFISGTATLYATALISNTGADNRPWWFYYNVTPATFNANLNANSARPYDLDHDPQTGNLNGIMVAQTNCPCPYWFWYTGLTAARLLGFVNQDYGRIVDFSSYAGCGGRCYDVILNDNANEATSRVGHQMRTGLGDTDGINTTVGLYVKQVGGAELAALEPYFVFEPASAIKIILHLYAMQKVQLGTTWHLSSQVNHYNGGPEICPNPAPPIIGTERLDTALQQMMFNSDNTRTREISDTFGIANINANALSIGMAHTKVNHVIGCGGPIPNQMTLSDAGVVYEKVANGTLINNATRPTFWTLMAGKGYDFTGAWAAAVQIIGQEAPAGMTPALQTAYENKMLMSYKAGGYDLNCSPACTAYRAIAGYVSMPYCSGGVTYAREYVWGTFVHGEPTVAHADTVFVATDVEPLREVLRANLASCLQLLYLPLIRR